MSTLATLRNEISGDVDRTDLSTQIDNSIKGALRQLQTQKTAFNTEIDTGSSTTSGSATMALPSNFFAMKSIHLSIGGYLKEIYQVTPEEILERRGNNITGQPSEFAIFNDVIQFDVTAADSYTATISYFKTDTIPSDDNDGHLWLTNAYDATKYMAKSLLYSEALFDFEAARIFRGLAEEEKDRLGRVFNNQYANLRMTLN